MTPELMLGVKVIAALFAADLLLILLEIFLDWRNRR